MTNKEAIDGIDVIMTDYPLTRKENEALDMAIKALEERPTGEWELHEVREGNHIPWSYIQCTNCGVRWTLIDNGKFLKYCFNCGAKMKRGEEE